MATLKGDIAECITKDGKTTGIHFTKHCQPKLTALNVDLINVINLLIGETGGNGDGAKFTIADGKDGKIQQFVNVKREERGVFIKDIRLLQ